MFLLILIFVSACSAYSQESVESNSSLVGKWVFYVDRNYTIMVTMLTDSEQKVYRDCYPMGGRNAILAVLNKVPDGDRRVVPVEMVEHLANLCTRRKWNGKLPGQDGQVVWQQLGLFSAMFIYPGTKWCGAGNVSSGYDDLGPEVEADTCCRDHDYCEEYIGGFEKKYGLRNSAPYTKSHCDCDFTFFSCLQEANTKASHRVGRIFFNFLQMECFNRSHPQTGCKRYHGRIRRKCQEYEFDTEGAPVWQWFDPKHYEPFVEDDKDNEIGDDDSTDDVFKYMLWISKEEDELSAESNKML